LRGRVITIPAHRLAEVVLDLGTTCVAADAAGYGAAPTASGVNPMVTIEAIDHMNASALAERLS
jgi:hypothetical protein